MVCCLPLQFGCLAHQVVGVLVLDGLESLNFVFEVFDEPLVLGRRRQEPLEKGEVDLGFVPVQELSVLVGGLLPVDQILIEALQLRDGHWNTQLSGQRGVEGVQLDFSSAGEVRGEVDLGQRAQDLRD